MVAKSTDKKPTDKLDLEDRVSVAQVPGPDPLWPTGAEPTHLTPEQRNSAIAQTTFVGVAVDSWACKKCGTHLNRSTMNPDLCGACYKLEAKNTAVAKRVNSDWMEQSEQCGLALYERQPAETDMEWLIWTTYRAHYPLKMPTWTELADECHVSVGKVTQAAQRWSFKVRLQAWARATDDAMAEDRIAAIREMNQRQTDMAVVLQQKLQKAIEALDPDLLRPNEIVQLLRSATELERRIKLSLPEKVDGTAQSTGTPQRHLTDTKDLGEVVSILAKTGMLPGQKVAVEQTTTTRLVAAGDTTSVDVVEGGAVIDTL